jgi:hypothetical protein
MRSALIIANSQYDDDVLRQITAPAKDAESLARVLADPLISGFDVKTVLDKPSHFVSREIETFFAERNRDDLLLLYFSGHGVKDEDGQLYLATADTKHKLLRSTALWANFINDVMRQSRSRCQILLLDCCYSGAFARGMTAKDTAYVGTKEHFEGRGRIVLTASDSMQYAFEGDRVEGAGAGSVFNRNIVRGLETGEADLNGDGLISMDELYNYVYDRVSAETPSQLPRKWALEGEGELIIARNPRGSPPKLAAVELQVLIPKRTILLGGLQFCFIPGATFPMGSDEGYPNQRPRHPVRVSAFFLASTPVTNAQFSEFVRQTRYATDAETEGSALCLRDGEWRITAGANWRRPVGCTSTIDDKPHHPVVQVTWNDTVVYCKWLSGTSGFTLDLPTEAQWEYAAAGPDGHLWAFGSMSVARPGTRARREKVRGCKQSPGSEVAGVLETRT